MIETRHATLPIELAPGASFARARAHEITGPARVALALLVAGRLAGPVLWLHPSWAVERLMGDGVRRFLDPARLILGRGRSAVDLLWAAEEGLRSGAMPLVVAELPAVPGLTAVRRLHLAAEAGAEAGAETGEAPLALLLTPDPGGAPGIESRWRMAPSPGWQRDGHAAWQLARLRARMAPEASWELRMGDLNEGSLPARDVPDGTNPSASDLRRVEGTPRERGFHACEIS